MKKEFLTPSMNITNFDTENIVTEASQLTKPTNAEVATQKLISEHKVDAIGEVIAIIW